MKTKCPNPRSLFPVVALSLSLLCSATPWSQAAIINVTSTADSGAGSLRQALASVSDGDTISFSVTGTITLTSGQLTVGNSVTILGPGPSSLAVDGNASSSVFHVNNGVTTTLSSLTITNGHAYQGGGINIDHATVTVSNCVISGNSSSDFGAGIFNDGHNGSATLTIIDSTISGNSANAEGGGIMNHGYNGGHATLTIVNSTLSGNSSTVNGGGIFNNSYDSGNATLSITNSTFSGNSCNYNGGAIVNSGSPQALLTVANSTITSNSSGNGGGGIINWGGPATLANTILAGNSSSDGPDFSGTAMSAGYNLIGNSSGSDGWDVNDLLDVDPLLGPLADNGGPTQTHGLLPGSPAIDAGDPVFVAPPNFDQRGTGFARVAEDSVDIGAFESGTTQSLDPKPAHQDAMDQIDDINTEVTDTTDGDRLNSANRRLAKALSSQNWTDSSHAKPGSGRLVFYHDAIAVKRLQKLLESNNSELDTNQVQALIDQVVAADRALAQTSIDEADGDVSKAVAELDRGDDLAEQGDPSGAIDAYKKAWKLATGG